MLLESYVPIKLAYHTSYCNLWQTYLVPGPMTHWVSVRLKFKLGVKFQKVILISLNFLFSSSMNTQLTKP